MIGRREQALAGGLSGYQLAVTIILFEIGSTPMFLLGIEAGRNAWIALLLGSAAGLLVLVSSLYLQRLSGRMDWTGMLLHYLGRWLGGSIAVLYIAILAYESMRNVRDFGEMARGTIMPQTPMWLIMGVVAAISCYAVRQGAGVLFRTFELLFPAVAVSYAGIVLLFFFSGLPNYHRLKPVMEDGIGPVIAHAIPELISFPFGQMFVFLLFWSSARDTRGAARASMAAYGAVSVFLVGMSAITLSILGADVSAIVMYPFIEAVQLIQIATFMERVDILVTLLVFFGLFVKLSVFYLASNRIASRLFGVSERVTAAWIGIAIYAAAFLEPNETFHLWLGLELQTQYAWMYPIVFPLLLLAIALVRRRKA